MKSLSPVQRNFVNQASKRGLNQGKSKLQTVVVEQTSASSDSKGVASSTAEKYCNVKNCFDLSRHVSRFVVPLVSLLLTIWASPVAFAQSDDPLSFEFEQEERTDTEAEPSSLRDLFEKGDLFSDEDQDSLAELLKQARELDQSTDRMDKTRSSRADESPSDDASDESGSDSEASREETERQDSSREKDLDETAADQQQEEETSQAAREMKARQARYEATVRHLQRLQRPLTAVRVAAANRPDQQTPENKAAAIIAYQAPQWIGDASAAPQIANRNPSEFCHRPLYYEEIDLERCGRGYGCLQNVVSAGHFLFNTAVLPYRMATQRADQVVRSRGDCRTNQRFGLAIEPLIEIEQNHHGVLAEAASVAGFTFLLL